MLVYWNVRNAMLNSLATLFNSYPSVVGQLWNGAVPAAPADTPAGTLLASGVLGAVDPFDPTYEDYGVDGKRIVVAYPWQLTCSVAGTPTFFRFHDPVGPLTLFQCAVGVGADIENSSALAVGQLITIDPLNIVDNNPNIAV